MKITPSTIIDAPLYFTGLKSHKNTEKCIVLRDLELENDNITLTSNLKLISAGTSVIDMTNNSFHEVPDFSDNSDCETLLLSRNLISYVDCAALPKNLQNLQLAHNQIKSLNQFRNWKSSAPTNMTNLSLQGNDICFMADYRLYIIAAFPRLKILDFHKISDFERQKAKQLDLSVFEKTFNYENTAVTSTDKSLNLMKSVVSKLDEATKEELQKQLASATTLEEMDRLEKLLSGGV
ncbi:hypothetical protein ACO0RG_003239 [Hanseniaspora osmophila]|uniref:U2 small nuclear ribonucleoprotein A' n=1 Tax=Hanseniaspora osmophila TaxID=56408 RepID=A0A1E5RE32_9ASCO|nr:U2 small nuclear ribonucleoprotein A' [Hanseniaspora osmophila]